MNEEVVDPNDIKIDYDTNLDEYNKNIDNSTGPNVNQVVDNCPSKDKEPSEPINDKNYKDQAQIFHPDRNTGCKDDAQAKMANLNNLNEKRIQKGETNPIGEESEGIGETNAIEEEAEGNGDSSNNFRYAIIRINANKEISVIDDKSSEDFSTESPYDLLSQKTPSVFAIKITKKNKNDCLQEANKKCINNDMFDSTYELDLTTIVDKGDLNDNNLISEGFLNAMGKPSDDTNSNALTIVDSKVASEETVASKDDNKDDSKVASQETVPNKEASAMNMDLIHKLEEMELLDFYLKSDMDKKILDKDPITEEDINNLIDEIFKKKDEKVDETAAKPKNDKHGNFGLPNIGKVCYISSLIHLLKDIKTYKPNENDSNQINSLTAKLFKNIEEGKTSEYEANYRALVTAFGKVPSKEGDPSDILDKYDLDNTVAKEIITAEETMSIQDVFNEKKNALTADYAIFTINRAAASTNTRSEWEEINITSPANYELAGKILHPPGHFVYVNYDDQNKPILYDDSRVEEFKKSSEKNGKKLFAPGIENYDKLLAEYKQISESIYQQTGKSIETIIEEYKKAEQAFLDKNNLYKSFNYDEQRYDMQDRIVTMVLYKKKTAAAITGGSRKNRAQKCKKTKRKYYVYRK